MGSCNSGGNSKEIFVIVDELDNGVDILLDGEE
jgi:hypothetical protein